MRQPRAVARSLSMACVVLSMALLAGCGPRQEASEAPRPVLVEHPGGGVDAALMAFPGDVHAREESPLSFRIGGNLLRRHVDAGAAVRRGQVLAELDPGDQQLQQQAAQAQLAAAEAELARIRTDRDRFRRLAADRLVSQSALDAQEAAWKAADEQARAARAQRDVARNQSAYARLQAPREGVIASRHVEAGQVVAAGQVVFVLAGDGGREVAIALPESRIRDFSVGQSAMVELWNRPGERLPGRIREIAAAADAQARTYAARVELEAAATDAVELGQSARVFLPAGANAAALDVPLSALQPGEDGTQAVWVVDPAGATLKRVPVRIGTPGETRVPVLSGLSPGDWVVSAGGHLLREGEQVTPVDRENRPVALTASKAGNEEAP